MKKMLTMVVTLVVMIAISIPALAEDEIVLYGISADGMLYSAQFITVDSEGYTQVYVDNFPMWVAGSQASPATLAEMDAEAAEVLEETEGVCKCFTNAFKVKFVGYCPCGGYCMVNGNEAYCSTVVV